MSDFRGRVNHVLRVLHVINGLATGGAEALLYRLVTRRSAIKHVVVSLSGRDWYSSPLEQHGITVYHLDIDSPFVAPVGIARLHRLIRQCNPDVVQCWMYRSNLVGGIAARLGGIPVVWGIHCSSLEQLGRASRALVYLGGFLARWLPDFIVNCSTRSAEFHQRLGYGAAAGKVIHNGYSGEMFHPDEASRSASRKSLGVSERTFIIGSITRWHPQKDIPTLLLAARAASDAGAPIRCLLVGRGVGPENPELDELIRRTGCSEIVVRLGERSDVQELARALDLHVLASCGEAFPNAVAETMLSGTPNVVTDVGDSAFMVDESGWIVPPSDPVRLSEAIGEAYREWRGEPGLWERRQAAARARIANHFTFEGMAGAYEEIWKRFAHGDDRFTVQSEKNRVDG